MATQTDSASSVQHINLGMGGGGAVMLKLKHNSVMNKNLLISQFYIQKLKFLNHSIIKYYVTDS